MRSSSIDALMGQVKNLTVDSTKYSIRAHHVGLLLDTDHVTPWAVSTAVYPPFIQDNAKLLAKIRDVRLESMRDTLRLSKEEFLRQANKLQAESEAILDTVDGILEDKGSPTLAAHLDDIRDIGHHAAGGSPV